MSVPSTALPPPGRIRRDVLAQAAGRAVNLLLAVGATLIVVRALGEENYGRWATLLAIVQIVGWFGEAGLERAGVQQAAADPDREGEYLGGLLGLRIAVALPTAALSGLATLMLADTRDMRIGGLILSLMAVVYAPNALRAVFQLRMRNGVPAVLSTVQTAIWAGCSVVIAITAPSLAAFAWAWILSTAVMVAIQVVLARRVTSARIREGKRQWRTLLRLGIPLGIASLFVLGYSRLGQILVLKLAGPDEASQFAVVSRLLDQAQVLPLALMTTMLPVLAALYGERRIEFERALGLTVDYVYLVTLPAFVLAVVVATPIMELLFGSQFAPSGAALPILMAAFTFTSLTLIAANLFLVTGTQKRFVAIAAAGLLFNVVGNVIAIPYAGFVGAAWVTLATEATVLVLCALALEPRLRRRLCGSWTLVRGGASSVFAGLVGYVARELDAATVVIILVFGAAYVAGLAATRVITSSGVRAPS